MSKLYESLNPKNIKSMKTKNYLIIILLCIIMFSCKSIRQENVSNYVNETMLYVATFEGDSIPFKYLIAYDKYEAMKFIDEQLSLEGNTQKYTIIDVIFDGVQSE
jgi:hypothetical protein